MKKPSKISYYPLFVGIALCIVFWLFMYLNNQLNFEKLSLEVSLIILTAFIVSHIILNIIILRKNIGNEALVPWFTSFLKWFVPIFYIISFGFLNSNNQNIKTAVIYTLTGIFFIILGLIIPKIKFNNSGVGIKFPWILNDEEAWDITHKKSSVFWVIGGIISIIFGFFPVDAKSVIIYFSLIFICVFICPLLISIRAHYYK